MKQCPNCNSIYSDDSLNYCLADGNPLVEMPESEDYPTVVHGEAAAAPATRIIEPPVTATQVGQQPAEGVSPVFKYIAIGLAVGILLLGIGGLFAWSLMRSRDDQNARTTGNNSNETIAATGGRQTPTPDARNENSNSNSNINANKSPERSPTPKPTATSTPDPGEDDDAPPPADPGEGRIQFQKGSDSKVFRGTVATRRSYVLRTMAGQRLNANVSSPDGCVTFDGGANSVSFTTPAGDVSLTVFNGCDEPSPFTISVRIR